MYLGVRLSDNGEVESDLEWRIGMAATAAGALRGSVFGNKELSKEAKLGVHNAVVVPTLRTPKGNLYMCACEQHQQ